VFTNKRKGQSPKTGFACKKKISLILAPPKLWRPRRLPILPIVKSGPVNRKLLLQKLLSLPLPTPVVKWIASYLSFRVQIVKFNGEISDTLPVNLGVVQGCGLGPSLFSAFINDLLPVSPSNFYCKYADDVTCLQPESSSTSMEDEMTNVLGWAKSNGMQVNFAINLKNQ